MGLGLKQAAVPLRKMTTWSQNCPLFIIKCYLPLIGKKKIYFMDEKFWIVEEEWR